MKQNSTIFGLLALLIMLALMGCSSSPAPETPSPEKETISQEEETVSQEKDAVSQEAETGGQTDGSDSQAKEDPDSDAAISRAPGENGMYLTQTEKVGVCTDTDKKSYDDFSAFLEVAEPFAITPGFNEKLVSQGMDQQEGTGNIYISGYFKRDEDNPFVESGNPTAVAVLNADGQFIAEYTMYNADGTPFTSHMGGVAVSGDTLYVSADQEKDGSGKTTYWIAAIPLANLTLEGHQDVTVEQLYQVPVQPSFMNYSNDTLWIGNFYLSTKKSYAPPEDLGTVKAESDGETFGAYILGYSLTDGGSSKMEPSDGHPYAMPDTDKFYGITNRIQGMTQKSDGTIVLSRSYGRTNNSELLGYDPSRAQSISVSLDGMDYDCIMLEASTCQTFAYTMMPMSEGITVKTDGNGSEILILYESGAAIYDGDGTYDRESGKFRTDYVWKAKP